MSGGPTPTKQAMKYCRCTSTLTVAVTDSRELYFLSDTEIFPTGTGYLSFCALAKYRPLRDFFQYSCWDLNVYCILSNALDHFSQMHFEVCAARAFGGLASSVTGKSPWLQKRSRVNRFLFPSPFSFPGKPSAPQAHFTSTGGRQRDDNQSRCIYSPQTNTPLS